jgi:hypothetical protein
MRRSEAIRETITTHRIRPIGNSHQAARSPARTAMVNIIGLIPWNSAVTRGERMVSAPIL